jgi:hypothetical protein
LYSHRKTLFSKLRLHPTHKPKLEVTDDEEGEEGEEQDIGVDDE